MGTFEVSKFDLARDPHTPKVGAPSPDGNGTIAKVQFIEATKLYERVMRGDPEPDLEGHRALLVVDHPTRPFVKFFVWVS